MAPYDEGGGGFLPPPTSAPRVRGGIRLQSRTGASAWWSRRWLAAFAASAVGERAAQGLADARQGQVLELHVELGAVRAKVQGTRRDPHEVQLTVPQVGQATWLRIAQAIAARGSSRAELLAGEMPDDVEAVFRREGELLFPALDDDAALTCTCEDWSVPCRHALAACHLLAEAMDREPLLAFRIRGVEPDVLRALVTGVEAAPAETTLAASPGPEGELEPAAFWGTLPEPAGVDCAAPSVDAPLVRILGAPPLWRGADSFEPAMRRLFARAATSPRAVDLALGALAERAVD